MTVGCESLSPPQRQLCTGTMRLRRVHFTVDAAWAACPVSLESSSCVVLTTSVIRLRENIPPVMDFRFGVPSPVGGLSGPGVIPRHLSSVFGATEKSADYG